MTEQFRRIVTARGVDGRSLVASDDMVGIGPLGIFDFWKTAGCPAALAAASAGAYGRTLLGPPPNGTCFRFFEIPPAEPALAPEEAERIAAAAFAAAGASHCRVDTRRHPMMHTTQSLDYVVLLRGELTLLLDEGEVALRPFDAVVQRGTNHYWINRGPEPALLMGVLVDAK